VASVDAHSHMTCVRLYAVMAVDFDDACVIHSRRIHGDMAGCLACYRRIHGNHWKHVADRAAWQRGTLPGCRQAARCMDRRCFLTCRPNRRLPSIRLHKSFGLGCRTETPSVASCRRRLHFISFVEVSFFEGAWKNCGRPRKKSQAKSTHI
jgi:hypothetical protein